jgi:hypothetical protein
VVNRCAAAAAAAPVLACVLRGTDTCLAVGFAAETRAKTLDKYRNIGIMAHIDAGKVSSSSRHSAGGRSWITVTYAVVRTRHSNS